MAAIGRTDLNERVNVLGIGIDPLRMSEAVERISAAVHARSQGYVCVAAAHSVMACLRDRELGRIFNRSMMTTPDGMPLVWLARAQADRPVERIYGPDLMLAMCERSITDDIRHYFYGGALGVAEELVERLRRRYPGLQVAGAYSPPFRAMTPEEDAQVLKHVKRSGTDIVWVGLGTGKQERWMADHLGRLQAPVMIGVGAAFDMLSGRKPQAPKWMQRSGSEWLFRLATEPRRLWKRHSEYPRFGLLVLAQLSGLREFPLEN